MSTNLNEIARLQSERKEVSRSNCQVLERSNLPTTIKESKRDQEKFPCLITKLEKEMSYASSTGSSEADLNSSCFAY